MSGTQWHDDADERLMETIVSGVDTPIMVTSFVLVATITTLDGGQDVLVNTTPGQRSLETLGLLRAGLVLEEEGLRREWFSD